MADFVKLMIVEADAEVREHYRVVLEQYQAMRLVCETDKEEQALNYLKVHEVDVIILDIELKAGNGSFLLNGIEMCGLKKPFIFVVKNKGSDDAGTDCVAHGVDYIYRKTNPAYSPEKILCVIDRLYPYQKTENDRRSMQAMKSPGREKEAELTRKYITDELRKLGFGRRPDGFDYVLEAIILMMKLPTEKKPESAEIYSSIAEQYHVTCASVERDIKIAIASVFTKANADRVRRYYPFDYNNEKGRPSNMQFLRNMAERLRLSHK